MRQASEWAVTQCLLLCIALLCIAGSVSGFALIGLIKSRPPFKVFSCILINETFFVIQRCEQFRQLVDLCRAFVSFDFVCCVISGVIPGFVFFPFPEWIYLFDRIT